MNSPNILVKIRSAVLLILILALASVPLSGSITSAHAANNLTAKTRMTFDQFKSVYGGSVGQSFDWDGAFPGECVDLFKAYDVRVVGGSGPRSRGNGYAYNYWTNHGGDFDKNYTKVDKNSGARAGDVAIFGTGLSKYGHVAIVLADKGNSLQLLHQNGNRKKTISISDLPKSSLLGYWRPKVLNSGSTPPAAPKVFSGAVSSALTVSSDGQEVRLKVCANNLKGQTVNATLSRPAAQGYGAKSWEYSQTATSTCVTFADMEGPGAVFRNVTYTSRAALNQKPSASWTAGGCFSSTGGQGLCDQVRRN